MTVCASTKNLFELLLDRALDDAAKSKDFAHKRACLIETFNNTIDDVERLSEKLRNMVPRPLAELLDEERAAGRME